MTTQSTDLELVRHEIDTIDDQILVLVLMRFRRLARVAEIKVRDGLPARDYTRERNIADRHARKLDQLGVDHRADVQEVLKAIADCGRVHVARLCRDLKAARHDEDDERPTAKHSVVPRAGSDPRNGDRD